MEQLLLVTALVILCTLTPTIVSHKLLHAGELINRENAKIRLGQLRQRTKAQDSYIIIIAIASHSIIMTHHKTYRDWNKGECLPSQLPFIWRLGEDVMAVCEQSLCL